MTEILTDDERVALHKDFSLYAYNCLKIQSKSGDLQPFQVNKAQAYVHERLERQLATRGYVRALVLKGRQQGISTYVGGRFYWKVTHREGANAFILTHRADTTHALFSMTMRYHENCPSNLKPSTRAASSTEIWFDKLDSRYRVGTAGGEEVGRGTTIQYFHGSEVAFWDRADLHLKGIFQAVPSGRLAAGTEIILESTANGVGNEFHGMWVQAEKGVGDYEAIFVPWFWQDEYRNVPPEGWQPNEENRIYGEAYKLDMEQMYWRELKLFEFKNDYTKFRQEYPANAAEAFEGSGDDVYIPSPLVLRARKTVLMNHMVYGPRIGGCDPAGFGDDRTSFAFRIGADLKEIRSFKNMDAMEVAGMCVQLIDEWKLDRLFIDVIGIGQGIYYRLKEMGYGDIVKPVNASERAMDHKSYFNKRAEMWGLVKEWLEQPPTRIPDSDSLHADLTRVKYSYDSAGRLKLEKKEDMKKRGVPSPDEGDALAHTFAAPVRGTGGKKRRGQDRQETAESNNDNPFA